MRKVLVLKSSILDSHSNSSCLVDYAISQWKQKYPSDSITVRDLGKDNLPMLDSELLGVIRPAADAVLNSRQKEVLALSDSLIDELKSHDTLLIGSPIYNFNISTQLKNYFDLICRAGLTFKYTETGPVGLTGVKTALVLKATGGIYGSEHSSNAYLKQLLGFIGVEKVDVITAEGVAYGDEVRNKSIADAKIEIDNYLK